MNHEMLSVIIGYGVLTALIIWRELVHAQIVNSLIDRIMAKDYAEFAQVEKYRTLKPVPKDRTAKEIEDDYAAANADRANQMLGRL